MTPKHLILLSMLLSLPIAGQQKATEGEPGSINSDWTEESHGNDVDPNQAVAFPQEQVNTLEITLTAVDWSAIRSDMQTKFGSDAKHESVKFLLETPVR